MFCLDHPPETISVLDPFRYEGLRPRLMMTQGEKQRATSISVYTINETRGLFNGKTASPHRQDWASWRNPIIEPDVPQALSVDEVWFLPLPLCR